MVFELDGKILILFLLKLGLPVLFLLDVRGGNNHTVRLVLALAN